MRPLAPTLLCLSLATAVLAQQPTAEPKPFAPGVVTTIPPDLQPEETVSTHDIVEVRARADAQWKPALLSDSRTLYGMSQDAKFRRDAWCLEFSFKPLRMIEVDVPGEGPKLVWYMVYAVRNTGQTLRPVESEDGVASAVPGQGGPVRFIPSFVLESHDRTADGQPVHIAYLDRVVPAAVSAIEAREGRGRQLLNSAEMAQREIGVDQKLWGVATWEDVDPRLDFFSVYVGGLCNAYRWTDPAGAYQPGNPPGTGREFVRKTLQLNFWRPGDEFRQHESEIRFGVAHGKSDLYGVGDGVAHRWLYR